MTVTDNESQGIIHVPTLIIALKNGLLVVVIFSLLALILQGILKPLVASLQVVETVTTTLSLILILVLPYIAYIMSGSAVRELVKYNSVKQIDMVEIDECVVDISKRHLPNISCGLNDERVNLYYEDGDAFFELFQAELVGQWSQNGTRSITQWKNGLVFLNER